MNKRYKHSAKHEKKRFTKAANKTKSINVAQPYRGGIKL